MIDQYNDIDYFIIDECSMITGYCWLFKIIKR